MISDVLLERLWGPDYIDERHLLQVNINRLRRKIEDDYAHPHYILTKVGFRLFGGHSDRARRACRSGVTSTTRQLK